LSRHVSLNNRRYPLASTNNHKSRFDPVFLKKILKKMRPDYMIPSEIHVLNELPIVSWDSLPNVKM